MIKFGLKIAAAASLAVLSAVSNANVTDRKTTLTLDGARRVIATAVVEAKRVNAPGAVIAVVDDGGNLVALERLDNTFAAGSAIATGKARTAALFKRPTKAFEQTVNNGRTAMVALPDFTPLEGGVPIVADGQVVGAIGVSGAASAAQDEQLAQAGAGALAAAEAQSEGEPVTYLDRSQVSAAFAKGAPLWETPEYKVHASRREKPGQVESPRARDRCRLRPGRLRDLRHRRHGRERQDRVARRDPRRRHRRRRRAAHHEGRRDRRAARRTALVQGDGQPVPLFRRQADPSMSRSSR